MPFERIVTKARSIREGFLTFVQAVDVDEDLQLANLSLQIETIVKDRVASAYGEGDMDPDYLHALTRGQVINELDELSSAAKEGNRR